MSKAENESQKRLNELQIKLNKDIAIKYKTASEIMEMTNMDIDDLKWRLKRVLGVG